jgi:broad specificity phosphatase PhoE
VNVGDLDGRNDAQAWEIYTAVLAAWRAGDSQARFPGGENRDELCTRLLRALTAVARAAEAGRSRASVRTGVGEGRSLVVAHGANLRAALPCLAGERDPGADLPTGGLATLHVDLAGPADHPVVRLVSWAGVAPG